MEHTPGPWEVGRLTETGIPVILQHPGPMLAELTKWSGAAESDMEVVEANARVMAASPALLLAAQDALRWSNTIMDANDRMPLDERMRLTAAIAQATEA